MADNKFNLKFEEIFKISTTALRINRSHPAIKRDKIWLAQFVAVIGLNVACFGLLVNSILFHDIQAAKYVEASKNSIMVIVAATIGIKYITLLYHQSDIMDLIRIIDKDYDVAKEFTVKDKEIILKFSNAGVRVCKIWFVCGAITAALFPLKAFLIMVYYKYKGDFRLVHMFEMTYPSPVDMYKDIPSIFCCLFFMCFMFDCYALTMYMGFDPLVPIFMLHICGQLEVVGRLITEIFSDKANEQVLHVKFKKVIIKLQEIYRFVDCVKKYFTVLYEYILKTTTFLLPLTAFQIVESLRRKEINFEFIAFFTGCILHFYIPCYYSDLLMETSERLRQTIYSCGWEKHAEEKSRKMVLFMLCRATSPLVVGTVFYPMCLDTFAEMCRHSYTIFNIMNAAWS